LACQDHQQAFKIAVVDIAPGADVPIPGVKHSLQKYLVPLRRQRVVVTARRFTDGIETLDVLLIGQLLLFEKAIE
jgi:hypothetical protein